MCRGYSSVREYLFWAFFMVFAPARWLVRRTHPQWRHWLVVMLALPLLTGCAVLSGFDDSETALTLTTQYNNLEHTYKSQYRAAGPDEREWLRENIAPNLDQARTLLIEYNQLVKAGEDAQDQQLRILGLLRQVSNQLLEVEDE